MADRIRGLVVVALVAVLSVAAVLRVAVVPAHHAMYVDEPWYVEAACEFAGAGHLQLCEETWVGTTCKPYAKAVGWPLLLSPLVALAGCATTVGISANSLLGVLTVLLITVAARGAGAGWWPGVLAAALLAIHPVHVAWSATGETNVAAAAAALAGLCGGLGFARRGGLGAAALAVAGLALATAIRPEGLLPALACAAALAAVGDAPPGRRRRVAAAVAAAALAAAAAAAPLWYMNAEISGGTFLSPANVGRNLRALAATSGPPVHAAVALLAFAGAVVALRRPHGRIAWVLIGPAVAGAVVALAYDRFHERMLLGATVAALPLVGFLFAEGREHGRRIVSAALVWVALAALWVGPLTQASQPPETQILETRIAARVGATALPPDALVVAEQPTVLRAAGVAHVMASATALAGEEQLLRAVAGGRSVHFLCDMYCEADFGGAGGSSCAAMLSRFAMTPVVEEVVPGRRYALYRVTGPADGAAPPDCPRLPGNARPQPAS